MTPCPRPLPFKLSTSPHPQTTRLLPAAPAEASLLSHPRAGGRDPIWSPCPRGENRALPPEAPRAMEGTLLALWALLVGWDAGLLRRGPGAAPQGFVGSTSQPGRNLTCYRCFKVASAALCAPTACSPSDRVCVSHAVSFFLQSGVKVSLSKRCAPRCPSANAVHEWPSETQVSGFLGSIARHCCNHSLCNRAPPGLGRPRVLQGALLLPLGLALSGALLGLSRTDWRTSSPGP
ncbi:lymphocyte antigen 6L isoform X7 [Artibeus jamaicensis]|uniref:lymphocyte antigen 6L isoform X7 n=1 Tax=Artibeus jamaicensis TaxID=9417 RepID=UPI00235AF286|nr:lymphocyte antigen 6L isoform X7 [Artibeus jamaicensis]